MIMPVVERELRVLSRRWTMHALRTGIAAVVMLGALMMLPDANTPGSGTSGATLFKVLSWVLFVLCGAIGVFLTSDQLSQEKREGTLGLLFLANLRGIDVIAGKVAGIGISALYGLVAALPVMALTLLLGGVTFGEFVRVSLALANILFGSLVCGIWFSTRFIHSRQAAAPAALLITIFLLGGPILALAFKLPWQVVAFSPGAAFIMAKQGGWFWLALTISHLLGWAMLWLGGRELERRWRDDEKPGACPSSCMPSQAGGSEPGCPAAPQQQTTVTAAQATMSPQIESNRASSSRDKFGKLEWLETDPVLWLIGNPERHRIVLIMLLVVGVAFSLVLIDEPPLWFVILWLFLLVCQSMAASQSTRSFVELRQSRMLEMLICTPQGDRIVDAQTKALRMVYVWPLGIVLGILTVLCTVFSLSERAFFHIPFFVVCICLASAFSVPAISCLGMWLALTLRKPQNARAIVMVSLVLPQIACCSAGILMMLVMPILFFIFSSLLKSDIRTLVRSG
jgi:hypothetical protein